MHEFGQYQARRKRAQQGIVIMCALTVLFFAVNVALLVHVLG